MPTQLNTPKNTITLNMVSSLLEKMKIPPQIVGGDWSGDFGIYTLAAEVPGKIGDIKLHCNNLSKEKAVLTLHDERQILANCVQHVKAQVYFSNDALCTPSQWSYNADILDAQGKGMENMRIAKSASISGSKLKVRCSSGVRKYDIDGGVAINWLLFVAVQRLEKNSNKKYEFTMLDHFDQIKKNQQLWYSQSTQVNVGGEETTLHAFDHVGDGIVPWVYWVTSSGQLVCAISGIEAYVAQGSKK